MRQYLSFCSSVVSMPPSGSASAINAVDAPMPWNLPSRFLYFRRGRLEHYGLTHPHHPWAPTKEIFQQALRGFQIADAFYSERKKTWYFKRLHLTIKLHFPATKTWCEYACFLFKKNTDPKAVPKL